jgi:cytoskeleton protein RodZ
MNELNDDRTSGEDCEPAVVNDPISAGQLLKLARENLGLHIAALAVSLKVPVKRVEALEANQWSAFPDAVYIRALASSVCRALKIDPIPVLERLPKPSASNPLPSSRGINAPFQTPGFAATNSVFDQISNPVVLVGLSLLVGALVLIFFPNGDRLEELTVASPQGVSSTVSEAGVVAGMSVDPVVIKENNSVPDDTSKIVAMVTNATDSVAPSAEIFKSTMNPLETANAGLMSLKSRGTSWVEVTDAKGVIQVRKILESGEAVDVAGSLPLSVVIGRADVIDVQLRGKSFDLQAVSKSNVARFEVK